MLDPNGHLAEEGAIVLDEAFTEVASADEADVKAARRRIDERFYGPKAHEHSLTYASMFSYVLLPLSDNVEFGK